MLQKLKNLDLSVELDKKLYKSELKVLQYEMLNAQQFLLNNNISLILVFEGMDAAGKGGAIKRLTERMDPRGYVVYPIAAPQPHELRYNYMYRFWQRLPQHGQIAIFDRSWYGRVLVERLEGFATEDEWERAYDEINDFERLLTNDEYIILKFWIHIDKDEQLNRFNDRSQDPYKAWKLTDEDWRNREKFDDYVTIADEMFEKTNSENAPWILVEGNNKLHARVQVLKKTLEHVKKEAHRRGFEILSVIEREEQNAINELEQAVQEVAAELVGEEVEAITSVRKGKSKSKSKKIVSELMEEVEAITSVQNDPSKEIAAESVGEVKKITSVRKSKSKGKSKSKSKKKRK